MICLLELRQLDGQFVLALLELLLSEEVKHVFILEVEDDVAADHGPDNEYQIVEGYPETIPLEFYFRFLSFLSQSSSPVPVVVVLVVVLVQPRDAVRAAAFSHRHGRKLHQCTLQSGQTLHHYVVDPVKDKVQETANQSGVLHA